MRAVLSLGIWWLPGLGPQPPQCIPRNGIYPLMNFAAARPLGLPRVLAPPPEETQKAKTPTPEPFDSETRKVSPCSCCMVPILRPVHSPQGSLFRRFEHHPPNRSALFPAARDQVPADPFVGGRRQARIPPFQRLLAP